MKIQKHCESCQTITSHLETLERKPSEYDTKQGIFSKLMLIVHELVNGGHYYNMDRYLTCSTCGRKVLENMGTEHE